MYKKYKRVCEFLMKKTNLKNGKKVAFYDDILTVHGIVAHTVYRHVICFNFIHEWHEQQFNINNDT